MSFAIDVEIIKEGMSFRNKFKKDSIYIGDCELEKIGSIPRLLSRTVESAIFLPLHPYDLKLKSNSSNL